MLVPRARLRWNFAARVKNLQMWWENPGGLGTYVRLTWFPATPASNRALLVPRVVMRNCIEDFLKVNEAHKITAVYALSLLWWNTIAITTAVWNVPVRPSLRIDTLSSSFLVSPSTVPYWHAQSEKSCGCTCQVHLMSRFVYGCIYYERKLFSTLMTFVTLLRRLVFRYNLNF